MSLRSYKQPEAALPSFPALHISSRALGATAVLWPVVPWLIGQ